MARQVFYSFHYAGDAWRTSQVRNIGSIEGNKPASDNDWETIKKGGDVAIKNWIDAQLKSRSATILLIGATTAGRPWINYEIVQSWNSKMGVAGIRIHNLKDSNGNQSLMGQNPFDWISVGQLKLSQIVKTYDSGLADSKEVYAWIAKYMAAIVEEAIGIRENFAK